MKATDKMHPQHNHMPNDSSPRGAQTLTITSPCTSKPYLGTSDAREQHEPLHPVPSTAVWLLLWLLRLPYHKRSLHWRAHSTTWTGGRRRCRNRICPVRIHSVDAILRIGIACRRCAAERLHQQVVCDLLRRRRLCLRTRIPLPRSGRFGRCCRFRSGGYGSPLLLPRGRDLGYL